MKNIFNKNSVSFGMYMLVKDGRRILQKNLKYFTSSPITIALSEEYTLCSASGESSFYSWALLNRQGVMIDGGLTNGKVVKVHVKSIEAKYLMVCGVEDYLKDLMILDSDVDLGEDDEEVIPPYIDHVDNKPESGTIDTSQIAGKDQLGVIKVGEGLKVSADGTVSADFSNISEDEAAKIVEAGTKEITAEQVAEIFDNVD